MSYTGYKGKSLDFLKKNKVDVGNQVRVHSDLTYLGILMPRYEYSDDSHIVLKLKNGYNVGLEIDKIKKIELESSPATKKENMPKPKTDLAMPKILLISTGGTIASKIDYRTGAVTPALTASELNATVPELSKIANIDTEVLFSEYSENLLPEHWIKIAEKLNSSKRNAFQTIGGSPAFIIQDNRIEKNKLFNLPKVEYSPKIKFDNRVALVKYYPGFEPKIMDYTISSGYKAIIFEGTGLGHVGKIMYDAIEKAKKKGMFVGMTSQCIDGMVSMTVYDSGRDLLNLGVTPLGNMIPETALVKAMWALANSKDSAEMNKIMKENIALEFSD